MTEKHLEIALGSSTQRSAPDIQPHIESVVETVPPPPVESVPSGPIAAVSCRRCGHAGEPVGNDRCANCQSWVKSNRAATTHGINSRQQQAALAGEMLRRRKRLLAQFGFTERTVLETKSVLIDTFIRESLEAEAYFAYQAGRSTGEDGTLAVTVKGRVSRAAIEHRKSAEVLSKLAALIGLEPVRRVSRRGSPLAALQAALGGDDGE